MSQLLETMVDSIFDKIRSGEYSAGDYANALKLLQNNGITIEIEQAQIPDDLKKPLPFPAHPNYMEKQ